ncbi:MAG: hypothetical protein WAX12_01570 [Candidatus Microthrix subdominans]|jgi:hypothetical protein|uniref:Uncharacterized protein n=1 Tax=Candidatus Neomicrothrix subdominans TaxID=2954438 RepID=A0A936TFJ8_9ACTN|nr:hypothetical protein [Candidatus Microthrix sp.]MBK9296685.1 hypothetical protein [Candidatus Microthrix subdominans]MBK6309986.1 hypothetical protein [Candidatus Microthrix sp.]MBK6439177.1 hypothetical protein [Candidatus Microthrix sp.]MBK6967840.1 hypothetical protein [Candidatus Microthrix sp.]MBK7164543.1 hypothetical protein [Candidatus Microthrix sp.]
MANETILGAQPRPRVAVIARDSLLPIFDGLTDVAPTVDFFNHSSEFSCIEYDIIVSTQSNLVGQDDGSERFMRDVFLEDDCGDAVQVYVASPGGGIEEMPYIFYAGVRLLEEEQFPGAVRLNWCRDVVVAECKPPPPMKLPDLVELTSELHDEMVRSEHKEAFFLAADQAPTWESAEGYQGLGIYNDGVGRKALAAVVPSSGGSEALLLPSYVPNLARWLNTLIPRWRQRSPERFPQELDWSSDDEWSTAEERYVRQRIGRIQNDKRAAVSEFDEQIKSLSAELHRVNLAADSGPRRMLTNQGTELVDAAAQAIRDLGFDVIDADRDLDSERGQKLEDLQIREPNREEWIALVEVRGYKGGAKTSDFQRLARFAARYERETTVSPSRRWLIVNHLINEPPASRPKAFESAPEDLELFAEDGGLVIDTRDLFQVVQMVEAGTLGWETAVDALSTQTGLFDLPSSDPPE